MADETDTNDSEAQNPEGALESMVRQEAAEALLNDDSDEPTVPFSIDTSRKATLFTVFTLKNGERAEQFSSDVLDAVEERDIIDFEVPDVDYDEEDGEVTYMLVPSQFVSEPPNIPETEVERARNQLPGAGL